MIKAAIVGCGNIAGFLDAPADEQIVTHVHAYVEAEGVELVACCDPDESQRMALLQRWNIPAAYADLQTLLANEKIDILSICSPTPFHFDALNAALNDANISTIICEKPVVQKREELDTLLPLLQSTEKKVLINFIRRYDPSIREAARMIQSGELGELQHFSGVFTKGLYHNGSHMLELIEHLCGGITAITALSCTVKEEDLFGSFYLETERARGTLNNESGDAYALFELEIVLSRGRVRITDLGHTIQIETPAASTRYAGYSYLKKNRALDDTLLYYARNSLEAALEGDRSALRQHLELSRKLLDIKERLAEMKTINWRST